MTGDHIGWLVIAFVAFVVVAWMAACAESALSRISPFRAEEAARSGRRGAERLAVLAADPTRYITLALLIRVVCEMGAAVLITTVFLEYFGSLWAGMLVSAAVMVLVSYVAVGVSPRTIGIQHPEGTASLAAVVLIPLARILGPVSRLLILLGNALTPGRGFREGPFASEAELRSMVDLAEKDSLIEDEERRMVHSVFELGDTIVREVMVPRTDLIIVERGKSLRQAMTLALRSGFSRIPVVGENEDDVVGIVYLKDLARKIHVSREAEGDPVEAVMRPASFVPDTKAAAELLREMQRDRIHLAVVVDEYGGTAGIVTIEDILEEIVGEIADEYDQEARPVQELGEDRYRVTARLDVDELGELFGVELDDENIETVGGLLAKALGRVPIPGATAVVDGIRLTAEGPAGRRNRIATVRAERIAPADGAEPRPGGSTASGSGERAERDHAAVG